VDPTDEAAARAKLPPIDSFNLWPYLSGATDTSPRTEVALGDHNVVDGSTIVTGLILGEYKLLLGPIGQNGWTGPVYPNISTDWNSGLSIEHCALKGCLFNIYDDPTEHVELGDTHPVIRLELHQRLNQIEQTVFSPDRGKVDPEACVAADGKYGGFWGPWLE